MILGRPQKKLRYSTGKEKWRRFFVHKMTPNNALVSDACAAALRAAYSAPQRGR